MACFRVQPLEAAAAPPEDASVHSDASAESLVSFMASEFAEFEAHSETPAETMRHRRHGPMELVSKPWRGYVKEIAMEG